MKRKISVITEVPAYSEEFESDLSNKEIEDLVSGCRNTKQLIQEFEEKGIELELMLDSEAGCTFYPDIIHSVANNPAYQDAWIYDEDGKKIN